jgi:WD40 repeat protein
LEIIYLKQDYINDYTFSPNGRYLVVAINYDDVVIFDMNTRDRVNINHNSNIDYTILKFSPNGKYLIIASCDQTLNIIDTAKLI